MQSFTLFNTKSYHNPTDTKTEEIIIHKNQSSIFDFLQPKQLTIFDFIGVNND